VVLAARDQRLLGISAGKETDSNPAPRSERRRAAPTRTSRPHLGEKETRHRGTWISFLELLAAKLKGQILTQNAVKHRRRERRTLCIGTGEVQDPVYSGKLSWSQGTVLLTSSLFFEAALVSPPGLEQGHNAAVERNGRGREALKLEETSKGEKKPKTDVRSKRWSY